MITAFVFFFFFAEEVITSSYFVEMVYLKKHSFSSYIVGYRMLLLERLLHLAEKLQVICVVM